MIEGTRPASRITFIIGGTRSGKSAFAESLASLASSASGSERVVYIATADARDAEMASRVAAHSSRRPAEWGTWEGEILSLPDEIGKIASAWDTLLLDSLTSYISAALLALPEKTIDDEALCAAAEKAEQEILKNTGRILAEFRKAAAGTDKRLIVVSDETGCGVVPHYQLGRRFRDLLGMANQIAAGEADEAALVTAGIPLWIKTRSRETH